MPIVGCPANGNSCPGVNMRTWCVARSSLGRMTNVVSERFHLACNFLHRLAVETLGVEEHGERISAETLGRKNVNMI